MDGRLDVDGTVPSPSVSYLTSTSTPQPTPCRNGKVVASGGGWVSLSSKGAKAAPSLTVLPRIRGCHLRGQLSTFRFGRRLSQLIGQTRTTLATNPLSSRAVLFANNVTLSTAGLNLGTPAAPLLITLCSLSFGACCMQASSSSASKSSQPSCFARIVKAVVFGELSWLTVPDWATIPATIGSSG